MQVTRFLAPEALAVAAGGLTIAAMNPASFSFIPFVELAWRVAQVLLVAAVWISSGKAIYSKGFGSLFLPWLLALLLVSVFHLEDTELYVVIAKQFLLVATGCVCAVVTVKSDVVGRFFGVVFYGSLALSILAAAELLLSGEWSWNAARVAKGASLESGAFLSNITLFVLTLGLFVLPMRNVYRLLMFLVFSGLCISLATRTPLVSFIFTFIIALFLSRIGRWRDTAAPVVAVVMVVAPYAILYAVVTEPNADLGRLLAGRVALWQTGYYTWLEAPFVGVGSTLDFQASLLETAGHMVFLYDWEFTELLNVGAGGFHSLWVEVAALYGGIGVLGVAASYFLILRQALGNKYSFSFCAVAFALYSRSFVEYQGLFAEGRSIIDFVSVVALGYSARSVYKLDTRKTGW